MRGRGLSPHHLFPRPSRRDGGLHHPHRGRQSRSAGAARQRQPGRRRATCPAPAAISRSGTIRSRSRPTCSRWSAASSPASRTASAPCRAATWRCASMSSPARRTAAPTPWIRSSAPCAGTKTAFGREYDLDIFMIVAVSDFNMGAMENKGLNIFNDKYVLASPGDRDRQRFRSHRGDHRARIFPQLDRQPHHLPRLVPALPQGRAHGLPRPGVHRRRALARGRAHQRRARLARPPVRRGRRARSPIRCGPRSITRSTTSTPRRSTRRAPRSCACSRRCSGPEDFRKGMDLYFARHDGEAATVEQFVQCFADASGTDLTQFMRWYSQAGTPEVVAAGRYDRAAKTYRLEVAQTVPPTPGQPVKEPMVIPLAIGLVGRDGRDLPLALADGRPLERGVLTLTKPTRDVRVRRYRRGAGALAQPRLLGADQARRQSVGRRSALPRRARLRSVQPLAGGADARHRACWSTTWRRCARAARPRKDDGLLDALAAILADGIARARLRGADADAAGRGRHRARDRPRRRSRRHLRGARRVARRDRRASRAARCSTTIAGFRRRGPYRPDRRERRPARAAQHLPRSPGRDPAARRDLARGAPIPGGRQHDRPHGGAGDAVVPRRARTRGRARRFLRPLSRRSADHRQVVRVAGDDSGARDARPGARRSPRIRRSRSPIPIACAR